MAYKIGESCVSCGACVASCPVEAIVHADDKYSITDACVDCGSCVDTCPVEAIAAE